MVKKLPELSIFFPFWNEEKNVESVVSKAAEVAKDIAEKWEILIIDDGSNDDTLKIAQNLAEKNSKIKVFSHSPNRGYGAALKEGFDHSIYEYVVFTDGDGQFDFRECVKFCEKIEDADIVIGFRKKRKDPVSRDILMTLLKIWDFVFFGFWFRDIDCGFKMFRKDALLKLVPLRSEGAMITTEILAKSVRKKLRIKQVEVEHYPRQFGQQSGAHPAVIIRAILETLILWYDIQNKRI